MIIDKIRILEKGVKAVGRLLVVVMEGENLADRDKSGKL